MPRSLPSSTLPPTSEASASTLSSGRFLPGHKRTCKPEHIEKLRVTARKHLPLLIAASKTPEAQTARIAAVRKSEKIKTAARRVHAQYRDKRNAAIQSSPVHQKDEKHCAAKAWILKDPEGQIHEFRNLANFIRAHADMFDANDVKWIRHGCHASKSLSCLRPTRSKPLESWKGWEWAGQNARVLLPNPKP